jgi:tRNA-uridine 2-sulfurtransferase
VSRVLVAMSGGVDSSVAAALLLDAGHDVVGVTMKLWGGESDTGCCSVSDVDDARRVAQQLGIDHHVFNFGDEFDAHVVAPYVDAHTHGRTPNPCVECNRHVKFDKLLRRAMALGFDSVATGHHARIVETAGGRRHVARGADRAKDQSYVVSMLRPAQLERVRFPVGSLTKAEVRELASRLGLRTAAKPDSQDVCFVASSVGRRGFLEPRTTLHPARVVDRDGTQVGRVDAVELVTVGQRRGLGVSGGNDAPRFVVDVDVAGRTVTVGGADDLLVDHTPITGVTWTDGSPGTPVLVQCSAHGEAVPATVDGDVIRWCEPRRRVAPGQTVAFYDGNLVIGSALVTAAAPGPR